MQSRCTCSYSVRPALLAVVTLCTVRVPGDRSQKESMMGGGGEFIALLTKGESISDYVDTAQHDVITPGA